MRKQELHPLTAVINKAQKNQAKKARTDALAWLTVHFPEAFDISLRIRPLKIGIMDDILFHADKAAESGISKSKLREALVVFSRRLDYLACLKLREKRIDLHGSQVGMVSDEEAEHAAAKIKKRIEKNVKNAQKLITEKASRYQPNAHFKSTTNESMSSTKDFLPTYPARSYSTAQPTPTRATVIVTHKATKAYDPDAVARLKEKLGLSRNSEEKKEASESEKSS